MPTDLTTTERRDLRKHEQTIERGLVTFQEVGAALLAIRDAKLYRDEYETFADYCEDRWSFTASRARQLIAAAKTAERVESVTNVTLDNEAQARELSRLPEEQQAEAWTEAVERSDGEPTAKVVRDVVEEYAEEDESEPEEDTEQPDDESGAPEDPSFCNDLDALIQRHRVYCTPWCIIVSVLRNTLERCEEERD